MVSHHKTIILLLMLLVLALKRWVISIASIPYVILFLLKLRF